MLSDFENKIIQGDCLEIIQQIDIYFNHEKDIIHTCFDGTNVPFTGLRADKCRCSNH